MTAWDYFKTVNGTYTMSYGGGASCASNTGARTIDLAPQVFKLVNGSPRWYSIGGAGLFQGPRSINPLRLSTDRTAVASHIYRVLVYSEIVWPAVKIDHATVRSACQGTSPALSIAWEELDGRPPAGDSPDARGAMLADDVRPDLRADQQHGGDELRRRAHCNTRVREPNG